MEFLGRRPFRDCLDCLDNLCTIVELKHENKEFFLMNQVIHPFFVKHNLQTELIISSNFVDKLSTYVTN